MTRDLEQIGLDAVDEFIDTWNLRDPERWAGSLNYPHVRPSPFGDIQVSPTRQAYVSRVNYDQVIATGWDHSEWDNRQVLHTSASKIHVAGQWSRYNSSQEVIHTNPVIYIVTRVDGHWGIQSRFGADYTGEEFDTSGLESRAFALLDDFRNQFNSGRLSACAEMLNYPHFAIGIGELREHRSREDFGITASTIDIDAMTVIQSGRKSVNMALDVTVNHATTWQTVMNLTLRDDHLGIQAWSLLNPESRNQGA